MKEREIKEKIGELQKQLKKKQIKKVIVDKDKFEVIFYSLILVIVGIFFIDVVVIPPSTILGIIGSFVIVLGVPYILMGIIKSFVVIKKHKKKK